VVSGDPSPLAATPLQCVRIGIAPESFLSDLDPEVERVTTEAFRKLSAAGAMLVSSEIPEAANVAMEVAITIIQYETVPPFRKQKAQESLSTSAARSQ
jgi:Asp-tRNA(Asn)/Glu-tRNA(Gln) amidotransferase A subunit family amidase